METPKYIRLITQMLSALDVADNFIDGFEGDDCQEDMSFATDVKDAMEAAQKYLTAFNHLPPALMSRMLDLTEASTSAMNSDTPFVAVVVDGGIVRTFVTNLKDLNIQHIVVDYDIESTEEPVRVRVDTPERINAPLSRRIEEIENGYGIHYTNDGEESVTDQLDALGL